MDRPSLFAQYLREKAKDEIIEDDDGFVTYQYLEPEPRGVYILDIFVVPDKREQGIASRLADRVALEAKERGCTHMIGSVVLSQRGATQSLKVLLCYGMELFLVRDNMIYLKKEI